MALSKEEKKAKRRAYYLANKERAQEVRKAYYEANKDKIKAYRDSRKDKMKVYNKEYYKKNKPKLSVYKTAYSAANKDKVAQWNQEFHAYYKEHEPETLALKRLKQSAKNRGKEFDLTKAWLKEKIAECGNRCEITGIEFEKYDGAYTPYVMSVDRIDNNKGYTTDNIQLVCLFFNMLKRQNTTEHTLSQYAERIEEYRTGR